MQKVLSSLFAVVFISAVAWSQDTATVVGTVTDTTGAVIPGAKVTVAVPDKAFSREITTNTAGAYTAPSIPIGDCVVTVEAQGFEKQVRSGITLTVGQTLRVDLELSVGQAKQSVTIVGNVPHVQTETASVSDVVNGSQIVSLDLNGRNFIQLATLVPGAVPIGSTAVQNGLGMGASMDISFNGVRDTYNSFELDGAPFVDETSNTATGVSPSLDSIAEFRIATSNYRADLGRHAGANVEAVTKSGTREFHGGAYEFLRNDAIDSNNWFINRQINPTGGNAPKVPLKMNNFGYTLGGPFYIPGHYNTDKSKTFFFWSQEWQRIRQGTVLSYGVPSLRMRQGDFSECDPNSPATYNPVVASGCNLPIDPSTGNVFAGDLVPIDPNAKDLLNGLVPLPNNGPVGFIAAPSLPTNWRQEQIRVDQNVNSQVQVFVRYTGNAWDTLEPGGAWSFSSPGTIEDEFQGPGKAAVGHVVQNLRPNILNEVVVGFEDNQVIFGAPKPGVYNVAKSLTRPSDFTMGRLFSQNTNPLLPGISIGGGLPFSVSVDTAFVPWQNFIHDFNVKDNFHLTVGKHNVTVGFYAQRIRAASPWGTNDTQGFLTFNGSGPITTTNGLADMYTARIETYSEASYAINGVPVGGQGWYRPQQWDFEPYFADDWKINRRLTLNLGIRYYLFNPWNDTSHPTNYSDFLPNLYNPAVEATLAADGTLQVDPANGHIHDYTTFGNGLVQCTSPIPDGCQTPTRRTLGPRFGFAYDLTGHGRTVVRGGYGIFYELGTFNDFAIRGNPPNLQTPSSFNTLGYESFTPGPIGPSGFVALPPVVFWPSVQQFSLGVEHEFPGNNLLSVGYVGNVAHHLSNGVNMNQVPVGSGFKNVPSLAGTTGCDEQGNCDVQSILINNQQPTIFFVPYTGYSNIFLQEYAANSNYNSLQINFRHTTGYGLTFQAAYTWSHQLDDASSLYFSSGVDDTHIERWYGNGGFNTPQSLVLNYIYKLPFFKNASNEIVKSALGGWEVTGITSFLDGPPVDVGCGILGFSSGVGMGLRCNSLGKLGIKKGSTTDPTFGSTPTWFDPSTLGQPLLSQLPANNQPGMFGYMGRNPLRGPGRNNWDLALLKSFQLPWIGSERSTLQFRWETFNSFNHPQWNGVSIFCSGTTAPGQPCSGPDNIGNGEVSSAWPARIMQFALKFSF